MKILDTNSDSFLSNNSLLRGEQVFTSLLFREGKLLFCKEHLTRLMKGAAFLFPQHHWPDYEHEIYDHVLKKVKEVEKKNYYCRLTIIDDCFFMILKEHTVTEINISLINAFQVKTPTLRPSFLKLSQYADSLLELRKANEVKASDVIFFDQMNFLTEASTSNVFVVKNTGELVTPYLSSMVLDGILRTQLIKNFQVKEQNITSADLVAAREIWLSNSIQGIRFVEQYEQKKKSRNNSLFDTVLENFGRFGEKVCE